MTKRRIFRTVKKADRRTRDWGGGGDPVLNRERAAHRDNAMRQLIRKYGGICALCQEPVTFKLGCSKYATIDHIQPLSKGGLDAPSNWQLACHTCNQQKGNQWQPPSAP